MELNVFNNKYLGGLTLILVSTFTSNQALAENYWGIGLGNSSFDIKPLYGSDEVDDAIDLKFVVGSRTSSTGYEMDLSFASYDWTHTSDATHNAFNLVFTGIGYLPVSESVDLYGKIGLNLWSTTVDYAGTLYEGDNGIGISFGGGIDFQVTDDTHFRLEYQQLNGIGDGIDEGDISNVTLTAVFDY
jgi:hypothetical protein